MSTEGNEPPPSGPPPISPDGAAITSDERTWGTIAHVSPLIAMFVGLMVLGPLVVWLLKKNESSYVAHHAREALNFQITMLIASAIGFATLFCFIGFVLLPAIFVANVILSIIGAVKANEGLRWTYPFSIRLVT